MSLPHTGAEIINDHVALKLALVVVVAASVAEQGFDAVQELLPPRTDLDGVDLIPS